MLRVLAYFLWTFCLLSSPSTTAFSFGLPGPSSRSVGKTWADPQITWRIRQEKHYRSPWHPRRIVTFHRLSGTEMLSQSSSSLLSMLTDCTSTSKDATGTDALWTLAHQSTTQLSAHATSFGNSSNLLSSSFFWTPLIMVSIVALLYTWEETIAQAKERTPATLMPVVDSMLAEVSGLGFIGLFLSVVVTGGPLGSMVGALSEEFLGDEQVLLESFEFLHAAFFEVGIVFFFIAGLVVSNVINKIDSISLVSDAALDQDRDGQVSLEELADILQVESVQVDIDQDGFLDDSDITSALRQSSKTAVWREVRMSTEQVKAEALVVRERFLQTCRDELPDGFRIEVYFEKVFADNLEKIVELSPFVWLILVPFGALGVSVDWSNGVISASSPNAAAASGKFLAEPGFVVGFLFYTVVLQAWGVFNFLKMTRMKEMLIPILVRDPNREGKATLLPPRYEDDELYRQYFESNESLFLIEPFEKMFAKPATSRHEKLFGPIGASGPDFYGNSIKFHTWLATVQIVFLGGQIAARDFNVIVLHNQDAMMVGNPDLVRPEFAITSVVVALAAAQLWLAPQTFLNYCLVTSIEGLLDRDLIQETVAWTKPS